MRIAVRSTARRTVRRLLVLVAVSLAVSTLSIPPSRAAAAPATVPGKALVRFRPGTADALKSAAHARVGASLIRATRRTGWDTVAFPADLPVDAVVSSYRGDPTVIAAEPDYTVGAATSAPSDSCLAACAGIANQWHLKLSNAARGWEAFPGRTYSALELKTMNRPLIAVLDTRVDRTHPDFANAGGSANAADGGQLELSAARDWVDASAWGGSIAWHGTLVAGLAAAATGNGTDAAGVGYTARILPLTVLDGGGRADTAALADAIVYAWERGARIINLSLGTLGDSQAVHDAITLVTTGTATRAPALVVAAAGNNTGSTPFYPGSYPEALSVAASDATDGRASCSNYNANVSVAAPADRLAGLAPMPSERMQAPCGTSAAAPQVSGLAALLLAQNPTRTPADLRRIIEQSADDLGAAGRDDQFGFGRINVERALRPQGPRTSGARATTPPASGGTSTITAVATSPNGVRAAQAIFDRPDATPVAMQPVDGAWGGTTEQLRGTIQITPSSLGAGPHPVSVRASDGTTWGAATVGIVPVDQRAPTIAGAAASNGVRATHQPMSVTFGATDDTAIRISYSVQFMDTATNKTLFSDTRLKVATGTQRYDWMPGLEVAGGHVSVVITVADEAGNISRTMIGGVLT